ncbi:hypothetical protein H9P43_008510 [Blastocladiella emersonii ATCC 22665]|nr:hypothetical protein H9P43_008510 [Blastocladiella emersonii ATCC 22665]
MGLARRYDPPAPVPAVPATTTTVAVDAPSSGGSGSGATNAPAPPPAASATVGGGTDTTPPVQTAGPGTPASAQLPPSGTGTSPAGANGGSSGNVSGDNSAKPDGSTSYGLQFGLIALGVLAAIGLVALVVARKRRRDYADRHRIPGHPAVPMAHGPRPPYSPSHHPTRTAYDRLVTAAAATTAHHESHEHHHVSANHYAAAAALPFPAGAAAHFCHDNRHLYPVAMLRLPPPPLSIPPDTLQSLADEWESIFLSLERLHRPLAAPVAADPAAAVTIAHRRAIHAAALCAATARLVARLGVPDTRIPTPRPPPPSASDQVHAPDPAAPRVETEEWALVDHARSVLARAARHLGPAGNEGTLTLVDVGPGPVPLDDVAGRAATWTYHAMPPPAGMGMDGEAHVCPMVVAGTVFPGWALQQRDGHTGRVRTVVPVKLFLMPAVGYDEWW